MSSFKRGAHGKTKCTLQIGSIMLNIKTELTIKPYIKPYHQMQIKSHPLPLASKWQFESLSLKLLTTQLLLSYHKLQNTGQKQPKKQSQTNCTFQQQFKWSQLPQANGLLHIFTDIIKAHQFLASVEDVVHCVKLWTDCSEQFKESRNPGGQSSPTINSRE